MSINGVSFKGTLIVNDCKNGRDYYLNSDRIIGMKANADKTEIKYDLPQEIRENGKTYYVPKIYTVGLDIDTVLNAYNAVKNNNIEVNLSSVETRDCNKHSI